ncbi:MAG: TetR/AcrR family transcriptional regulator [Solirubrobacterales bacterium]|nr:TetR/AcrR family transcriptional regulator [Thermoleophilales bacterium]MCO5325926.1 TetR/AcrR family transcriptional regulator [Solirubrobacterales bacterium]
MSISTRDRLLDVALERFADGGVLRTTLDEVREEAGTSVGAVYHHFPDKAALYEAVQARALADYQAGFVAELEQRAEAEAGVRAIVGFHFRWCAANPAAARMLLDARPSAAPGLNRDFFTRVRAWWGTHVHYGAVRDLDFMLIHSLWLGASMEMTRHWLAGDAPKPKRSQTVALADAAWASLKEGPR